LEGAYYFYFIKDDYKLALMTTKSNDVTVVQTPHVRII